MVTFTNISEPVKLIGEGEYNMNVLTEIEVTESYLALDKGIRGCQNEEPLNNCTTRQFIETFLEKCGCLPPKMGHDEVSHKNV